MQSASHDLDLSPHLLTYLLFDVICKASCSNNVTEPQLSVQLDIPSRQWCLLFFFFHLIISLPWHIRCSETAQTSYTLCSHPFLPDSSIVIINSRWFKVINKCYKVYQDQFYCLMNVISFINSGIRINVCLI